MALTPDRLDQYRQDGYAVGGRLFDTDELTRLRREIDALIAALPEGQRPENMPSVHFTTAYFRELFLDDRLVDVAEQILGADLALFTSYVICKSPRDGLAVAWHQDAAFFPIEPMSTFTLWVAVDDSESSNGCLRVPKIEASVVIAQRDAMIALNNLKRLLEAYRRRAGRA